MVFSVRLCQVVAVVAETAGIRAPIAIDLDEELKEDLLLEEILDVLARLRANAFEGRAGFANDDAFLAFALAIDDSAN